MGKINIASQAASSAAPGGTPRGVRGKGRRGFLTAVGATGLASSIAIFRPGKAEAAEALCHVSCCGLSYCPNESYATCAAHATYIWSCWASCTECANCCESPGHSAAQTFARCPC